MGHDEINLTYSPGFFGWPYFIANNKPYSDRKFSDSSKPGPIRNPAVPALNNSPRNMGMQVLPLARPAWIYYPYMPSSEFPELGKGGRTAMAGPWIPADANGVNLPSFYKGKLLIYDWMRGWVFAVDPDPDKKPVFYRTLTRFSLSKPMDIELGPDGNLYMLEYGTNWFAANPDARLSRLKYSIDNHEPMANLEANPAEGGVPLTVRFSAAKSFDDDPDDALHYEWRIESPSIVNSRKRETRFTFRKPGIYTVRLVVTDKGGKSAAVATQIRVGNYPPKLQFQWGGNSSFYWPGMAIPYEIKVEDPEDEASGGIRRSRIEVFADFMQNTEDQTTQAQGHQTQSLEGQGRSLIQGSDCKNCHQEKLRSAGPSWVEIGNRYRKTTGIVPKLANKIILGGAGVWGDHAMSAHPQLSTEDARLMVTYILSLEQGNKQILPATGRFVPNSRKENEKLILTAQYKDLGAPGMGEIETRISHILRTPKLNAQDADKAWEAFPKNNYGKAPFFMKFYKDGAFIAFEDVDLTQVKALHVHGMANGKIPLFLEVVCDSLKAPVLGSVQIREGEKPLDYATYQIPIKPTKGRRNLFLRLRGEGLPIKNSSLELEWLYFAPNGGKGI
jgi:cytochrome c